MEENGGCFSFSKEGGESTGGLEKERERFPSFGGRHRGVFSGFGDVKAFSGRGIETGHSSSFGEGKFLCFVDDILHISGFGEERDCFVEFGEEELCLSGFGEEIDVFSGFGLKGNFSSFGTGNGEDISNFGEAISGFVEVEIGYISEFKVEGRRFSGFGDDCPSVDTDI